MVKSFLKKHFNIDIKLRTNLFLNGSFDVVFACIVLILFAVGIVSMYSASYAYAAYYDGDANVYFTSQLRNALIGFLFMILLSKLDYKIYNGRFAIFAYFITVAVLLYTIALGAGDETGTSRWIYIGPFQLQPSEFAKMSLIIVMSYLICVLKNALRAPKGKRGSFNPQRDTLSSLEIRLFKNVKTPFKACLVLAFVTLSYCFLILLEKHYSATILIGLLGIAIAWLSGANRNYFAALVTVMAVVVAIVIINPDIIGGFGFAASRIKAWLDPTNPIYVDQRRQTVNGLYAIGSGGLFGVGFGNSVQKQLYIPEPQNDFVFSVFCEEFGFIGAAFVLILFAALICRGMVIATKSKDYFGSLIVMGVVIQVALQVIINLAVVTDLIPNTGMALPFFSYGGSSLIALLGEMGLVLSVSRNSRIEKE